MDEHVMVKIKKVEEECKGIKTFWFDHEMNAAPGQFVMVWLPGMDEKPFTLSSIGENPAISVQCRGDFTKKMHQLKKGDVFGVRGPFGHGFHFGKCKKPLIVGGGCGSANLTALAEKLEEMEKKPAFILGARTGELIPYEKRLEKTCDLYITTDDGSRGEKGFTTETAEKLLKEGDYDCVFACGPEPMLVGLLDLCRKTGVECQFSLERFMKCAIGLCGQCCINGKLVCVEGPVFDKKQLEELTELGKFARTKSGKLVGIKEYSEGEKC